MKKTLLREQEREEVTVELATEEPEVEEVVEEEPKKKKNISHMFKDKAKK